MKSRQSVAIGAEPQKILFSLKSFIHRRIIYVDGWADDYKTAGVCVSAFNVELLNLLVVFIIRQGPPRFEVNWIIKFPSFKKLYKKKDQVLGVDTNHCIDAVMKAKQDVKVLIATIAISSIGCVRRTKIKFKSLFILC